MTPVDTLGLLDLLKQHLGWYPMLEVQDVYKLLFQGVLGSEHLIDSKEEFSRYLEQEYDALQMDASQVLFEPVRPDGMLFRINLRAYKARQLGLNRLVIPVIQTTQLIHGTKSELKLSWGTFTQLCQQGYVRHFDIEDIVGFTHRLEESGFNAMHHSETYRRLYQPAYRLIFSGLIPLLGIPDEA
jgi:hypothetical protein